MKFIDSSARCADMSKVHEAGIISESNQDFLVVGVVGLAAAGKSTIASLIAGNDQPLKSLLNLQAQKRNFKALEQDYQTDLQFKSGAILDALSAWERKIPFKVQQNFTKQNNGRGRVEANFKASALGMRPQTAGIDIYTSPERIMLLDTPALFSDYFQAVKVYF